MAEKFYSSRLLNYVERVDVGGFPKTAFYTEVNTNLKAGDRVFIQNGNYDSDDFIDQDRYAKYVDGYRVISIDRCRIVLDIDFIGLKPYQEDHIDNFIKIWNVKSRRDLLYYDSMLVDSYNSRRVSKFEWKLSNNLIFSAATFSVTRPDASSFTLNRPNSFWAKKSNGTWELTSTDINNNTFALTGGSGYFSTGYTIGNNGRLFIYGEDFTYNDKVFKQRNIYKYQDNQWIIDTKYKTPVLSKLNFRDGRFKGTHYDGVWGTYQKSLNWSGTFSNWQSGVLVNSNWINGNLNSKSTIASQSNYGTLDASGLPVQTSDFSNNKGQGYNYILDSNVYSGIISDGNFINCNIGTTISSTVSVVNDYFNQIESYKLVTKGGLYNFCDIFDSKLDDSSIFDSRVYNSHLNNSRLLNSQFFDVVADGEFNADNGLKVLAADIYSYIPGLDSGLPEVDAGKIRGVLKLFISESDLLRLDAFDNFYITKINKNFVLNSLTSDQKVILPFETKYILDRFYNGDFSQQEFTGVIKNPSDNKYKPFVTATGSNFYNTFELSGITYSSIDLDLGQILAHYYQGGSSGALIPSVPTYSVVETTRVINHLNVNNLFTNTVLRNADFVSGILEDATWYSGAIINRQSNIISSLTNNRPSISVNGDNLDVQISSTQSYFDGMLQVGKNIWLDSVYNNPGRKASVEVLFGNWIFNGTSSLTDACTFSTSIGTFSFIIASGSSYGQVPNDFIQDVVLPTLSTNSMGIYYSFSSNSTPSAAVLKIESREVSATYSFTAFTSSIDSNISFFNNTSGVNYVGQNISGRYLVNNLQVSGGITTLTLQSQQGLSASLLTSNEFFFDSDTNPYFMSIHQVLLRNLKITSGLFKRSLISNSIFYNESFNNQDRNLSLSNIEQLRITKTLFKNNLNDVKSGMFYRNHFFGGTWSNGIAYEMIWKDAIFNSGIFKSGYWKSGIFNGGKFIESLSTTASALSFSTPDEYLSWVDGSFQGGEFEGSSWRNGTFSNGKFFNSDWYAGTWQNGILGDINIPYTKTTLGSKSIDYLTNGATSTVWLDGVVENALVGGDGAVYWHGGKFNNGLFTSNGVGPISGTRFSRQSIWYGGEFNGGEFSKLAKWKNGNFNGGFFNSYFGWTMSHMTSSEYYGWENGNFNGGKFGNAGYATNSIWYDGVFNDGIFQGRLWNYGIFNKGNFIGGATWSPRVYESNFVNSFTNSYYGLWRDGIVIDVKTNIPSEEKFFTKMKRVRELRRENVDVTIKNALWLNGTFSSNSAIFDTSAWLGGRFLAGKFKNSIFNPFVNRNPFDSSAPTYSSFNKNTDTVWINGEFQSGNFYYSEWKNGTFQNGTMSGAIWRNGTWNYGDANNIYWQDGRWRNGNWDGSPFIPKTYVSNGTFAPYTYPSSTQFTFFSNIPFLVGQKVKITQTGSLITIGTVNLSFIFFANSYSVTIDIISISGPQDLSKPIIKLEIIDGFADFEKEIITRVAQVAGTPSIHLINAFTPVQEGPQLLAVTTDDNGNNLPQGSFWNSYTYSNFAFGWGKNLYIKPKDSVKVATTGAVSLSGTTTVDGVSVNIGDRVLVKNQNGSTGGTTSNGVYIVQSGSWVRAQDSDKAGELSASISGGISYYQGFLVEQGAVNSGYTFVQYNNLYTSLSSTTYSISGNTITVNDNQNLGNNIPIRFTNIGGLNNINLNQLYYIKNLSASAPTRTFNIGIDTGAAVIDLSGVNAAQVTFTILKEDLGTQNLDFETDGTTIWSNPQICYAVGSQGFCYPASAAMRISDSNRFSPDWRGAAKPLVILAKGATAAVFTETVGLGGYYLGEVKFFIENLSTVQRSITVGIEYGLKRGFDNEWTWNSTQNVITLNANSATFSTMTFSYEPDPDRLNASLQKMSGPNIIPEDSQYYVETGWREMAGKMMQIFVRKNTSQSSSNYSFIVNVLSSSVKKYSSKYDSTYNNKLYNPWGIINPTPDSPALLPTSIFTQSVSDTGSVISLKYGNGNFVSGIWENGVWNNGWRSDTTMMRCLFNSNYFNLTESITSSTSIGSKVISVQNSIVGIDYVKVNSLSYEISVTVLDALKSIYKVGDKVSVSNIAAVDENGNRSLIKNFSTIVSINSTTKEIIIACNVPVNTIRIEVDSQEHVVLITKNIWLSGAFLNGYFNGIWNYGLFQGYPYITLMSDSHWIDGIFDGGRIRGTQSSFTYSASGQVRTQQYSVPLIQNFEFFDDNNTSTPSEYFDAQGYKFFANVANYLSWIDVNYYTHSKTNLGQDVLLYDVALEEDNYQINLNGYPTNDILSSKSSFRNLTSNSKKDYNLGIKYKTFQSFIPNSDLRTQFLDPISNSLFVLPFSGLTLASKLMRNFTNIGWTYSSTLGTLSGITYSKLPQINSNVLSSSSAVLNINLPAVDSSITLNNTNINIEAQRYSMIEFSLARFSGPATYSQVAFNGNTVAYPSIYLRNDPRSDGPGVSYHQAINRDIVNHILTNETIKREYFFNRKSLSMYMYGKVFASFKSIAFKEIDMVPFFQYATQSQIDDDVKSPYKATAPFIDYTNSNFNFIGNISVNIDSVGNYSVPYTSGFASLNAQDLSSSQGVANLSDYNTKTNLVKIGESVSGLNIYTFEFTNEPGVIYKGVIAQELIGTSYETALIVKDGLYHVDYSMIDVSFEKI